MDIRYRRGQSSEEKPSEAQARSIPADKSKNFLDFAMKVRRRVRQVPLILCLMLLTSFFQVGQSIWPLSIPHQAFIVGIVPQPCHNMGLSDDQKQICMSEANRELLPTIRYGASLAYKQCQYQFKYRRWNCSVPEKDSNSLFRRITGKGTKEAAFTYAISAAGVVHSIARSCVEGNLSMCGCSRERRPKDLNSNYQWGGCGDNIEYGAKFAKKFMKAGENSKPKDTRELERKLMNLHNNEVGIQVIRDNYEIRCRCHGISQSCEIKTCWKELVQFSTIGEKLRTMYDKAVKVRLDRRTGRLLKGNKKSENQKVTGRRRSTSNKPTIGNLIYLESSPNYCIRSKRRGILGTAGRECKVEAAEDGNCYDLCCRRGFLPQQVLVVERCECKFHWCCEIRCKECRRYQTKYFCL
ncbi:protein Wnt-5a-like isoform X2 [Pocillopora damicornis]|uniref:protein Wnt-5a-like isoform X2 n=1 Tax=Pocillopora damicornis TaxID=46731 RepID=UPI000F5570AF|nr:protein Wnt-5a-like isoform X2 [Pocillopora damicornis]